MGNRVDAVLIAGPTASGKSRLALALADALGGTVINADSMQVYREPRILTARPRITDMSRVPHMLYGHVGACEAYSVGRYQTDAARALAGVRGVGRVPIFVGGTGLYFSALTDGLANIPPIPASVRAAGRGRLEEIGVAALHAELSSRDPETAAQLRASDPQRVLRAWEVLEATGRPLARWQKAMGKPVLDAMRLAKFVLDVPRRELRSRIETRFKAMLDEGAMEEAALLHGLDPALPAAKILGLRELWALKSGALDQTQAIQAAVTATRQFAKRQTTWLRHRMKDWNWLELQDSSNILPVIMSQLT